MLELWHRIESLKFGDAIVRRAIVVDRQKHNEWHNITEAKENICDAQVRTASIFKVRRSSKIAHYTAITHDLCFFHIRAGISTNCSRKNWGRKYARLSHWPVSVVAIWLSSSSLWFGCLQKDNMPHPLVVHCKKSEYDEYIGRPSKWGNPFVVVQMVLATKLLKIRTMDQTHQICSGRYINWKEKFSVLRKDVRRYCQLANEKYALFDSSSSESYSLRLTDQVLVSVWPSLQRVDWSIESPWLKTLGSSIPSSGGSRATMVRRPVTNLQTSFVSQPERKIQHEVKAIHNFTEGAIGC